MGAVAESGRRLGRKYLPGEIIFQEGDQADGLYIIQDGGVELRFPGQQASDSQGIILGKGQMFGEAALFGQSRARCATARVLADSSILKVDDKTFMTHLHQDPSLAFHVLRNMADKIQVLGGTPAAALALAVDHPLLTSAKHMGMNAQPAKVWVDGVVKQSRTPAGFRILMIEDDPDYQALAQAWLPIDSWEENSDSPEPFFSLRQTDSLAKALDILTHEEFDLILLDLNLPDSAGLESITRVLGKAANVPIVVFSGTDDENQIITAAQQGAEDYLIKGQVSKTQFIRSIRSALARHRLSGDGMGSHDRKSVGNQPGGKGASQLSKLPWLRNPFKRKGGLH
ncbi:MAG: cyclic nucleotide-binding domain-containing protein [Magnetococcales bacterium]|nr:cyclic nucleotide-binding domain-containing protein [Magnetococcales bacterium]